ncbi:hypothetical protein [Aquisediminimonas sediminicola]|uniref:hypothetical protein n=1 Tax=Alteraquisediminimonas sediminicola TaxID=2676787 RepID=UPI001C8E3B83|nr:hypothetical protein [Aquisediminimonas sediminicola]
MSDNLVLVIIGLVLLVMVLLLRRMTAGKRGQRITLDVDTSVHSGLATKRAPKTPEPVATAEPAPVQDIAPTPAPVAAPAPVPPAKSASADTLTRIKGIGPKIADLLQREGVTQFSQIAGWTEADLAAIDAKLGNFAGRPTRDQWIEQAKLLASGDDKAFESKFGALGGR